MNVEDDVSLVLPRRACTILLGEDDPNLRAMLAIVLRRDGRVVQEFGHGGALRDQVETLFRPGQSSPPAIIIISDLRMPEVDGLSVLRRLHERGHRVPFVLLTAFGSPEVHADAAALGAAAVLDKPFDFDELTALVRRIEQAAGSPA